jgi:hypothetical protein
VADLPEFQRKQYEFAAHIRDPEKNAAPPGIEDRRLAIYRDLFFNNLQSLLGSTFPVLKKLSGKERWRELIREFMAHHQAQTPYFLEIPKEFLAFLEQEHTPQADDFPFLLELAHYEWVELALSVSADSNDMTGIDPDGDLLDGVPVISVLAWPLEQTGREILLDLAEVTNFEGDVLVEHGAEALAELRAADILLGTRRKT